MKLVGEDLRFRGTVETVECNPLGARGGWLDWIVRMRVVEVLKGTSNALPGS